MQLSDTSLQVIEIVPPAVRTTLMHQENAATAMPLDDFLDQAMNLLQNQPNAEEIVIDNARFLRYAEANGTYQDVLAHLSAY